MSTLGIFHTVIGVFAVIAGAWAFYKDGKIMSNHLSGQIYLVGTIIAGVTAFGLSKTGSLNEAHVLTAMVLIAVGVGLYFKNELIKVIALSLSFFLSLIPASVETLTRLPVDAPIAADQNAPILQAVLGMWFFLFLVGVSFQIYRLKNKLVAEDRV